MNIFVDCRNTGVSYIIMLINEGQSFVINYHSLSLTDDVYSLFPLENCLQSYKMSNIQYSNAYHSI